MFMRSLYTTSRCLYTKVRSLIFENPVYKFEKSIAAVPEKKRKKEMLTPGFNAKCTKRDKQYLEKLY